MATSARAEPPPSPVYLQGYPMVAGGKVILAWTASPEAVTYNIYFDQTLIGSVPVTLFLTEMSKDIGANEYFITAVNADGEESGRSMPGVIEIAIIPAPENFVAVANERKVTVMLLWGRVPECVGYNIYRAANDQDSLLISTIKETSFTDQDVKPGSTYDYYLRGVDRNGREGELSEEVRVTVGLQKTSDEEGDYDQGGGIKVIKDRVINRVSGKKLPNLSYLGSFDKGVWVVAPELSTIIGFDEKGHVSTNIGRAQLKYSHWTIIPHKLGFDHQGDIYVTDVTNSLLARMTQEGNIKWVVQIATPKANESRLWQGFPVRMTRLQPRPSSVLCLEQEIWVTDQRFQLLYRYSYDGTFIGYHTHYKKKSRWYRFRQIGEVRSLPDGKYVLTFPLVRKAIVVDGDFNVVSEINGDIETLSKGFVSLNGVENFSNGQVMLTDTSQGYIRIFNPYSGEYITHLEEANSLDWYRLNYPKMAILGTDNRIWVYEAGTRSIVILRML